MMTNDNPFINSVASSIQKDIFFLDQQCCTTFSLAISRVGSDVSTPVTVTAPPNTAVKLHAYTLLRESSKITNKTKHNYEPPEDYIVDEKIM